MSQHPAPQFLRLSEKGKVVSTAEAVRLIRDGARERRAGIRPTRWLAMTKKAFAMPLSQRRSNHECLVNSSRAR